MRNGNGASMPRTADELFAFGRLLPMEVCFTPDGWSVETFADSPAEPDLFVEAFRHTNAQN